MTRQIDQLENNQTYLQGVVERYGLEASPELEEAKRKIAAYEKSIGRTESMINQASTEQILAYGKKCESYLNFGNSVDRVLHPLERASPRREAVLVCTTPGILREVGLKDLPMHITQKHIINCTHEKAENNSEYHGLSKEEIKKLPEALENPVILTESFTQKESVVAVLDFRDKDGKPIIVAIHPNGQAVYELKKVESNFVQSMYGRNKFENFIQRVLDEKKLLYINRTKSKYLGYIDSGQEKQIASYDKILKKISQIEEKGHKLKRSKHL